MLKTETLYSLADISVIPEAITDIRSRQECNPRQTDIEGHSDKQLLPIIVSPMSCNWVGGISDAGIYRGAGINTVIPRTIDLNIRLHSFEDTMTAFSLDEAQYILDNIANPETYDVYCSSRFDFVRVGIGGGAGCLTSTQTSIHYPMASLLDKISKRKGSTKVIADGGISGYSDAIKCLALGADYVMMGKVFTKAAIHGERIGSPVNYYGMSTKLAQREMGCLKLKTSEGKFEVLRKEYTLDSWVENFTDYLRSAMSYTGAKDLRTFRIHTTVQVISPNSSYKINNK